MTPTMEALLHHFGFCVTGVVSVVAIQWEDYHGLGGNSNVPLSRTTALPVLPCFAANLAAFAWLFRHYPGRRMFDRRMWALPLLALIGEAANQASIVFAGSLTFTVVYSSLTVWTALFSIPILGKRPTRMQWGSLLLIVGGLLSSAASHTANKAARGSLHVGSEGGAAAAAGEAATAAHFFFGAVCGLVGSVAYGLMCVRPSLTPPTPPPPLFVGSLMHVHVVSWRCPI
jgi:drug/metabolite transporter (DMT)-like permease